MRSVPPKRLHLNGLMPESVEFVPFGGGLDMVSPALNLKPGVVIGANNYQPDINGGYLSLAGMERFSGQSRPSDANYCVGAVTLTGSVSVGDTILGNSSGATGEVIKVNGSSELILAKLSGDFSSETISVGGSDVGTISSCSKNSGLTMALHAAYRALAAELYRDDISAVPGSGPVRGVWHYDGEWYCFRDNAGATACYMYKATTSGWTQVTFGHEVQFTNAVGQINDGDTVTCGAYSGVVKRALLRTGTWTSAGAGTLVFDSVTGTFPTTTALQVGGVTKATSSGTSNAITLKPGGKYQFQNYNFSGGTDTFRMYLVDGVNYLHEFDGTRLVPIRTGISGDAPKYLNAHKNHMFVALKSSVQHSGVGYPYSWTALTGASELGTGKTVTGMLTLPGGETTSAMAIFSGDDNSNQTHILYGSSSANWNLVRFSPDSGAIPYTAQNVGAAYFLDAAGITSLASSQEFGNFRANAVSRTIQPMIDAKKSLAVASCVIKSSSQYRLFFSDGTGVIVYLSGNKVGGIMPFDYGDRTLFNVVSVSDSSGNERIMACGDDGYVYELDRGTSLDGDEMSSYLIMAFNASKSPRTRKHYRKTIVQASCPGYAQVSVGYELDYGDPLIPAGDRVTSVVQGGGGWWDHYSAADVSFDSPYIVDYRVDTAGYGSNIGLVFYARSAINDQHKLHSAIMHYTPGRMER